MRTVLILRKLSVENANAISGLTWGFPAISHFLGFMHSLGRDLPPEWGLEFKRCGVVCHHHHSQVHGNVRKDLSFALTRNPLDSNGNSPSFVEEGRIHLELSLVIDCVASKRMEDLKGMKKLIWEKVLSKRLAGGTIVSLEDLILEEVPTGDGLEVYEKRHLNRLLPGFALIQRSRYFKEYLKNFDGKPNSNESIERFLDFFSVKYEAVRPCEDEDELGEEGDWRLVPKSFNGWLVPIVVGYRGISQIQKAGSVDYARDKKTSFRFVEPVYTVGEWVSPHRLDQLEELFWRYRYLSEAGYYLCENQKYEV